MNTWGYIQVLVLVLLVAQSIWHIIGRDNIETYFDFRLDMEGVPLLWHGG